MESNKPKRQLSEKQRQNFLKAVEARKANVEKRKQEKAKQKEANKELKKKAYKKAKEIIISESAMDISDEETNDCDDYGDSASVEDDEQVVERVSTVPSRTVKVESGIGEDEYIAKLASQVTQNIWERLESLPSPPPPPLHETYHEEEPDPPKTKPRPKPKKAPAKKPAVKKPATKKKPVEEVEQIIEPAPRFTMSFI